MTRDRFLQLLDTLESTEKELCATKGEEYTHGNDDRLSSFKETAALAGVTARQACFVFMLKHFQAVASYSKQGKVLSNESLQSRVTDLRLYAALFLAVVEDEAKEAAGAA